MTTPLCRLRSLAVAPLLIAASGPACVVAPPAPAPVRPEPTAAPLDGLPAARAVAERTPLVAEVAPGGDLSVGPPDGPRHTVDHEVRAELALSADGALLVYARQSEGEDSDLYAVTAPFDAEPEPLTDWPGAEDRPALSPDLGWVAFVSGRTGIASIWALPLSGAGPAVQLTNVGLEDAPRRPGAPPEGFVPPPQTTLSWTTDGLRWTADGRDWRLTTAELAPLLDEGAP